jgi:antitoxin component YwqK of YwqJK toxin-antitoxin module
MNIFRLIVLFLLIQTIAVYGQSKFEFLSGRDNYLIEKIENPVKIVLDNLLVNPNNLDIKIEGGTVRKTDTCIWVVMNERNATITVTDKEHKLVTNKSFTAIMLPLPFISLDGRIADGIISKYDLINSMGFSGRPAFSNAVSFAFEEKVLSYSAKIYIGNETRSFRCDGALLSDTVKYFLKKLKPFDRVEFSQFKLGEFRQVHSPFVFEINHCHQFVRDLQDILYDNYNPENYNQQTFTKPFELPIFSYAYYDAYPQIVETNCNSTTDTCSMSVYYLINNNKTLTYRYYFQGNDSLIANYFYHDRLIASIGYWRNSLCGAFSIFYPNGEKRAEGEFKPSNRLYQDTIMGISPITLKECLIVRPRNYAPVQHGIWKYYDNGILLKTMWFKDGELIEEKKY